MAGLKVYGAELKVCVFDFGLAEVGVVMDGHKDYMSEHNVHVFDLILD
jgi:hypothetical protein